MWTNDTDTRQIWFWLVAAISITSFFIFLHTPFNGDDWAYKMTFEGPAAKFDSWLSYPRWCGSHWLTTNGRIGNYLAPPLMALPSFLRALLCAGAIWLMYWASIKVSGARKGFLPVLLATAFAFGLPWWDSMFIFDCQLNYIWTSALVMSACIVILNDSAKRPVSIISAFLLCGAAGISHEAASAPLAASIIIWCLMTRKKPSKSQLILFVAFAIGTALVTLAPGIILRSSEQHTPDDPLPWLLLKSDPIVMLLWLTIAVLSLFGNGRRTVGQFIHSIPGLFAIAALLSMCISAYSGIVGRTGWFAEIYAFVAIIGWLHRYGSPRWTSGSLILSTLIVAQTIGCAVLQYRLHKESVEFESKYLESEDGLVFMDCTRDNEIPWWTLGRLRGIPDADDGFILFAYARYHGRLGQWPVVIPTEARKYLPLRAGSEYILTNGDILTAKPQNTRTAASYSFFDKPLLITEIDGRTMTVQQVPGGWYLSPLITDPGDRYDIEL